MENPTIAILEEYKMAKPSQIRLMIPRRGVDSMKAVVFASAASASAMADSFSRVYIEEWVLLFSDHLPMR
jgi:hypothetical protein